MKIFCTLLLSLLSGMKVYSQVILPGKQGSQILLPNGWSLSPAGRSLPLGDLPLNIAVSSSKKLIAVSNNGQSTQTIQLIDPLKEKILSEVEIPKSWYGLKFSDHDRYLYVSGGNDNQILKYKVDGRNIKLADSIILGQRWPVPVSPTGIDIDENRKLLYTVTKENNSLYIADLTTNKVIQVIKLEAEAYTCLLSPDKTLLYISCWGCNKVAVFDTRQNKIILSIAVGNHPNELCMTRDGKRLFVSNANDNSVSIIDTGNNLVTETLDAALFPSSPQGSTSNGVALSEDEKTLFIANADNNCLAVFDISNLGQSRSKGFIPVGWYPTNVKVIGDKIFVTNGKGFSSMANPHGPNPMASQQKIFYQKGDSEKTKDVQYIAGLFKGTLSIINIPGAEQLSNYSRMVYKNTPYNRKNDNSFYPPEGNPVPATAGGKTPVKYIFYIIKENRTYDQVLGDIKEGNGDPSLVLFGEKHTPNLHSLARNFVLLDNFYADAEVSEDGHVWSMGAYATDYIEKTWPTSYGHRGGNYSGEGIRSIANNKNGFIWDDCKRSGVSYRSYGEFTHNDKPNIQALENHICTYYTGWDLTVKDTVRYSQWKRDFDSLLAMNKVPQLNTLRFSNDHTEGLRKGRPTPFAHVADNDLAVGLFMEHLSHSSIWKETAVFIVEDDAQNGPDHVDAHRTTAYLAGGFVKRRFVDHTMYSTTSILKTIEMILGMAPMSQYDAAAVPMWRSFNETADITPFESIIPSINLDEKNIVVNEWQKRSEKFNLKEEDAIPEMEFNLVLWHGIKGNVPYPVPHRAGFVKSLKDD